MLTILAASDIGPFRAQDVDVKKCANRYQAHIERHALRSDQIGQARIYSPGFKQVAEVFYSGTVRLSGRSVDRAKAALLNRKIRGVRNQGANK